MEHSITVTDHDYKKLLQCLQDARYSSNVPTMAITKLGEELKKAVKVPSKKVTTNVVTMNSRVSIEDMETKREFELTIVYPANANIAEKRVSVLAPIGTALLGYTEGSIVEWEMPNGMKRLLIKKILYQPEAHGNVE
ncbi:GreA/GreB family elongation factor [Anseongella ginsenosidimutans]|uniref:GreA/GreB family elongation factor n=1 Tax=Anseongella ginsenosidimutans TaxID=496056 RepID=A0A4R3KXW5_9SPHI|nr:nucleoside diphosphate kinase regulator [Anseongella ginsenosidimutans]QEC51221.1 nucleoside diphosphate kinase regulator [Anseongella ginsenosidimutans]TCS90104.1 GreA/GreB family elongation factor [Anseongella ginsenosidimutans]